VTAEEVKALVDEDIRRANRAEREAVLWDSRCEPFLLARPELRAYRHAQEEGKVLTLWLVFGPARDADFDYYQVVFDEERTAFGLGFRGVFIGYCRSFMNALEGMPRTRERVGSIITCPVCGQDRSARGAVGPLPCEPLFAALLRQTNKRYEARYLFVCRECIAEGRATEADASRQLYCDYPPYRAYFDVTLKCEDCKSDFVFSASEQRFWYEELKFWVQSHPKQCRDCRRIRRERGARTRELGEALATPDPKDPKCLADLYVELGAVEKAVVYLKRAKNRTADPDEKAVLIERLERLSLEPGR
jgi:hypothetical protein